MRIIIAILVVGAIVFGITYLVKIMIQKLKRKNVEASTIIKSIEDDLILAVRDLTKFDKNYNKMSYQKDRLKIDLHTEAKIDIEPSEKLLKFYQLQNQHQIL